MSHLIDLAVAMVAVGLAHAGWRRGLGTLALIGSCALLGMLMLGALAWLLLGERRAGPAAVAGGLILGSAAGFRIADVRAVVRWLRPGPDLVDDEPAPAGHAHLRLGWRLRADLPLQRDRSGDRADRALGAALYLLLACMLGWWATGVAAVSPLTRPVAGTVTNSLTYRGVHALVAADGRGAGLMVRIGILPGLPEPEIHARPADPAIAGAPTLHAAAHSTLEIGSLMCGTAARGSGWVAAPGIVATNAHVVAGATSVDVRVVGGRVGADGRLVRPVTLRQVPARVIAFDPIDDVALLQVEGVGDAADPRSPPVLPLAHHVRSGTEGVIAASAFGPPWHVLVPARVDRTIPYTLLDLFGRRARASTLTVLRAQVQPGYSGSAVLDTSGHVIAMIAARDTRYGHRGGYAVPAGVLAAHLRAARHHHHAVSTGPCTPDVA